LASAVLLAGCGARADLNRRFANIVYFNGINEYEAVAIAELRLAHSVYKSWLGKVPARLRTDEHALKHPRYWFVDFSQKFLFDSPGYLVVVDRNTGEIKLATEYFPRRDLALDGIVERLADPAL
jgi:hypothetical protein